MTISKLVLAVLLIFGIAIGAGTWHALTVPIESGNENLLIHRADGAWCAPKLPAACVSPNGEVTIPSGDAWDTLLAYGQIMDRISPELGEVSLAYSPREGAKHQTQQVIGRLNASEVLNRMLEESGLVYKPGPRLIIVTTRGAEHFYWARE